MASPMNPVAPVTNTFIRLLLRSTIRVSKVGGIVPKTTPPASSSLFFHGASALVLRCQLTECGEVPSFAVLRCSGSTRGFRSDCSRGQSFLLVQHPFPPRTLLC